MKTVVMLSKVFFSAHPKAGENTNFADKVRSGEKIHTIRDNCVYWRNKVERLKEQGGVLSLREWSGKPYRSPQSEIKEIPAHMVDAQPLRITRNGDTYAAKVDGKPVELAQLAKNDGFDNVEDFAAWFKPVFDKAGADSLQFAIIHFTPFSY